MRLLKKLSPLAWVYLLLSPGSAAASGKTCVRVPLAPEARPGWTTSGAWSADGQRLILVDALGNRLLGYDGEDLAFAGELPPPYADSKGDFLPSALAATPDGFLLEVANASFLSLDPSARAPAVGVSERKMTGVTRGGLSADYFFSWALADGEVLAFSDLASSKGWVSGFIRSSLRRPEDFRVLSRMRIDDPARLFYRLGHQLLTAQGNAAYAILMGPKPTIVKSEPGGDRLVHLTNLPVPLDRRPSLPEPKTGDDFQRLMKLVESSSLPTGLFAWGDALFLVSRQFDGTTSNWWVSRVNPHTGRFEWSSQLGATANHLTTIPGPKQWAFVEKGPVEGFGLQRVRSILLVPSERFQSAGPSGPVCE